MSEPDDDWDYVGPIYDDSVPWPSYMSYYDRFLDWGEES